MALVEECACARAFRVVVVVAALLVGLCLPGDVLAADPERDNSQVISLEPLDEAKIYSPGSEIPGFDEAQDSVRSRDVDVLVSVQSVALKHVVARGAELEDSNEGLGSYSSRRREDVEATSWMVPESADHRIGKRMVVPEGRGRNLRVTMRPPYPCNLPPGACQAGQTCCGSACVTVSTNTSHCGRCGHMCSMKRVCCSGKCRRLATDEKNCGRCGARCAAGIKCLYGLCGYWSVLVGSSSLADFIDNPWFHSVSDLWPDSDDIRSILLMCCNVYFCSFGE